MGLSFAEILFCSKPPLSIIYRWLYCILLINNDVEIGGARDKSIIIKKWQLIKKYSVNLSNIGEKSSVICRTAM